MEKQRKNVFENNVLTVQEPVSHHIEQYVVGFFLFLMKWWKTPIRVSEATRQVIFSSSLWDFQQRGIHMSVPATAIIVTDMSDIKSNHFNINLPCPPCLEHTKWPFSWPDFTREQFEWSTSSPAPHLPSGGTTSIFLENLDVDYLLFLPG